MFVNIERVGTRAKTSGKTDADLQKQISFSLRLVLLVIFFPFSAAC